MSMVIIAQTAVLGSGRQTKYHHVPTNQDVSSLRARGFVAELVNVAPRGGVWGVTIQVPPRQAAKAKRVLAGESVYASRAAERAAKAAAKAKSDAAREVDANVASKSTVALYCDVGSVKIAAAEFTALHDSVWRRDGSYMVPNGYGDGDMRLSLVRVRDIERRFSRHEAFGNVPPTLMAEARGQLKVYSYDCGGEWFRVDASEPIRIYSKDRRVYIVGTSFACPALDQGQVSLAG